MWYPGCVDNRPVSFIRIAGIRMWLPERASGPENIARIFLVQMYGTQILTDSLFSAPMSDANLRENLYKRVQVRGTQRAKLCRYLTR